MGGSTKRYAHQFAHLSQWQQPQLHRRQSRTCQLMAQLNSREFSVAHLTRLLLAIGCGCFATTPTASISSSITIGTAARLPFVVLKDAWDAAADCNGRGLRVQK
jgi:hypothetical protein